MAMVSKQPVLRWRDRAAGRTPQTEVQVADDMTLSELAQMHGKRQLDQRKHSLEQWNARKTCCCWVWLVKAPSRLLVRFGKHVWRDWLLPPLAWLFTTMLHLMSMLMDATSMLFMAIEEDVRFNESTFSHGDRHISHELAQLTERHFDGKTINCADEKVLWIVLFYSPRSKVGSEVEMEELKNELQQMSLAQLLARARSVGVEDLGNFSVSSTTKKLHKKDKHLQSHQSTCGCSTRTVGKKSNAEITQTVTVAEKLDEAKAFQRRVATCGCRCIRPGTPAYTEQENLKADIRSLILRATYKRSGVEAVQRFNSAARHFAKVSQDNLAHCRTRMSWPECPVYEDRKVRLGVVNIDDIMSRNDELAINMGVRSLEPHFMLLDGDNVPMVIAEERVDMLLAYGSEFWDSDDDGSASMQAVERMLQLVAEDRREKRVAKTDAVHALIEKTATIQGAVGAFIAKYGNRQRLLRCAQHILHGSTISTAGAMQTVLISSAFTLAIFTGFGEFFLNPGWMTETVSCDKVSNGIDWEPVTSENITDRWSCRLACESWSRNITRTNMFSGQFQALFRYSAECRCGPDDAELDKVFNEYLECFDDVFMDGNRSWAESAPLAGLMTDKTDERVSQLLHSKIVIVRYWDVQLLRYILQFAAPAAFLFIFTLRTFAGLPPLRTASSLWFPWLIIGLLCSCPLGLMYVPSYLTDYWSTTDDTATNVQAVTISLGGVHLYGAVVLMIPLLTVCAGLWYLSCYCGRDGKVWPITIYHGVWGFVFFIHLIFGVYITLWTNSELYHGDENSDLATFLDVLDIFSNNFTTNGLMDLYNASDDATWKPYFKLGSLTVLGFLSSATATWCTKKHCLAVEKREQLQRIAAEAEARRELVADEKCTHRFKKSICGGGDADATRLLRANAGESANKWTSGNLTPHVELVVIPTEKTEKKSGFCRDKCHMDTEELHSFETSIELLLNVKLALGGATHKIDASVDAYLLWKLRFACAFLNDSKECAVTRYFPGNGKIIVHVWFSPPEFLQQVLANPDKNEYVLRALLRPLDPSQKEALEHAVAQGGLEGWARLCADAPATANHALDPPLVEDRLEELDLPRARWADELDFSEIGMDKIARWYPAFFFNSMLTKLLLRLQISEFSSVGEQMVVYLALALLQLLKNILTWTIQQMVPRATHYVKTCGKGEDQDIEKLRRHLTDESKIRAIVFECTQFAESWSIMCVVAAELIYVIIMNCPMYTLSDPGHGTSLLDLVSATAAIDEDGGLIRVSANDVTQGSYSSLKDVIYQDPFSWDNGHIVFMTVYQLALELPVDILSTRALELLRQPVFSALRPHLANARMMFTFQICLSLAMLTLVVTLKHEVTVSKLLHDVNCSATHFTHDECEGFEWNDPPNVLDVCCYEKLQQPPGILHDCSDTLSGSCWIETKDSSLVEHSLGSTSASGEPNDAWDRIFAFLKSSAFVWGSIIVALAFIPKTKKSSRSSSTEYDHRIRKAVDAGLRTRKAQDFLAALKLEDYGEQIGKEYGITNVTDFWRVDPVDVDAEKRKVKLDLHKLLEDESKVGGCQRELSELVMRDKHRGITADDIRTMLTKYSDLDADDDSVEKWLKRIRYDQNLHGDIIFPGDFDDWARSWKDLEEKGGVMFTPDPAIQTVIKTLRDNSEQRLRSYLVEVTTSIKQNQVGGKQSPRVWAEFFGGYDSSSGPTTDAAIDGSDRRYIVGDRIYTRSSGALDLAAYHRIPLPGTDQKLGGDPFAPGCVAAFEVRVADLGAITAMRVWLANGDEPVSWRCDRIAITCTQTMDRRVFQAKYYLSKGEIYTQKNTGKLLKVKRSHHPATDAGTARKNWLVQEYATDTHVRRALSQLQTRPNEPRRHSRSTEKSSNGKSTNDNSSGSSTPDLFKLMLSVDTDILAEDMLLIYELHHQDVQDNLNIVADGQKPPIALSQIKAIIKKSADGSGNVQSQKCLEKVGNAMRSNGCPDEEIKRYFDTRAVVPAWQHAVSLYNNSTITYTITLRTGDKRKAGFTGRMFVQLLGVVDGKADALPVVVAGRFLPVVKDPAWFSTEEAKWQKRGEERVPDVTVPESSNIQFDYPSTADLGELLFCRVWHDQAEDHLHLLEAQVTIKRPRAKHTERAWEFPCNAWVADEIRPVPFEFMLPPDSPRDDGLLELMQRSHEKELEHKLSQDIGMTKDEIQLFATSRSILKRKMDQNRHAAVSTRGFPADEEEGVHAEENAEQKTDVHMSSVHLAVRAVAKAATPGTSMLRARLDNLGHLREMKTLQLDALAKVQKLKVKQANLRAELERTETALAAVAQDAAPNRMQAVSRALTAFPRHHTDTEENVLEKKLFEMIEESKAKLTRPQAAGHSQEPEPELELWP